MKNNATNKELIAAGHQLAKTLNMDTPLIEIAKLLSEMATRLDCAIVRGDVLAAENVALKGLMSDYAEHKAAFDEFDGDRRGIAEHLYEAEQALIAGVETPATDAFANRLRAEGAIAVRDALVIAEDGSSIYATVTDVVNKLRAGKDGE